MNHNELLTQLSEVHKKLNEEHIQLKLKVEKLCKTFDVYLETPHLEEKERLLERINKIRNDIFNN